MKKKINITIPEACHENWDAMTATERGRFCSSCSQEVTDFSTMTDQQILYYLSKSKRSLCGRFNTDQLDRSMMEPTKPMKKTFWAALFSFVLPFIAFNKAQAQKKPKPPVEQTNNNHETVGKYIIDSIPEQEKCDYLKVKEPKRPLRPVTKMGKLKVVPNSKRINKPN